MDTLWGIDLGGTKIEGIVLDKSKGHILSRTRVPTQGDGGYEHVLNQIKLLISMLEAESGTKTDYLGICTPGTMDPVLNVMKNCNSTSLNGKNLKADLEKLLNKKCSMSNDANCFALAETKMGIIPEKCPDAKVVFGVILGTGVGGGIVVDGKVINGRHGIGGEWGHNFLDESGGKCYCGRIGCVETVLAGPAIQKYYKSISNHSHSVKEIVELYRKGEENAFVTMDRYFTFFGKAIAYVINILDPDAIVIGGGVGNIDEIYTLGVEKAIPHVFNHRLETSFFKPKLGDSAGVFGAAYL
ncbi:MAG: ROK family protein [Saprospiraceae bacterium]|nr:ROK family protein [Saprospiraceae bacterium]